MIRKFEISRSSHGTPAIQIQNPTEEERSFIKRATLTQMMDDVFYLMKQDAKPFLQSESRDFIMIEFWGGMPNALKWVEWLNGDSPEIQKAKEIAEAS